MSDLRDAAKRVPISILGAIIAADTRERAIIAAQAEYLERLHEIEAITRSPIAEIKTAVEKFGYALVYNFASYEGRLPKDRDDLERQLIEKRWGFRSHP